MLSPYTYYDPTPSSTGRGRRFYSQIYRRGFNPRAGGIGGLVKVALVGTAAYFVCKKIYQYVAVCFPSDEHFVEPGLYLLFCFIK